MNNLDPASSATSLTCAVQKLKMYRIGLPGETTKIKVTEFGKSADQRRALSKSRKRDCCQFQPSDRFEGSDGGEELWMGVGKNVVLQLQHLKVDHEGSEHERHPVDPGKVSWVLVITRTPQNESPHILGHQLVHLQD